MVRACIHLATLTTHDTHTNRTHSGLSVQREREREKETPPGSGRIQGVEEYFLEISSRAGFEAA